MATPILSEEITVDLLRSAWLVERARAEVFGGWAETHSRFETFARRADERARIVETSLEERGRSPDAGLVAPHASWMRSCTGGGPDDVPLSDLFLARLGDWVEAHVCRIRPDGTEKLRELGDEERSGLVFPESLPPSPPYEPVGSRDVEPPGPTRFRFGILGDLHIGPRKADAFARRAVEELNASGAALVVQLGDITDHGNKDEFERAGEILDKLEMPFATMTGNHDVFSYSEERLWQRDYYPSLFGREPDGVVLEHDGFRFAILDSAESDASPFPPFSLITGTFTEGVAGAVVRGSLTPPQHDLLADVAAPESGPAFVFLHHPPQPFTGFPPVVFGLKDEDSARLHATCDSGNVWGVFAGHTHRNARTRTFGSVPAHEVASPRDFPFGYALVDVGDDGYAFRFVQLSDEALLRDAYTTVGTIHRRYGAGSDEERAFVWHRPT